jgi:hypothetical protein
MLLGEMSVYAENHDQVLCDLQNIRAGGTSSYHCDLRIHKDMGQSVA